MKLFNTLTRRKEEFVPLEEGKVRMYVCGPTVYNLIHIGNARPMIIFDTVRRYMEYKGYEVNYVSNFTDVDDKIIKKAIEEGVSAQEISERYIAECKKDMDGMNVKPATTNPQATQEINGMISMIQTLVDKGYAYPAADGTVYFRVKKFKEYGKLSHKNLDDLQSGFRSLQVSGEDQKEDPLDFVLWKPKKEGEPSWPSPWCDGRPGWHIECSVMAKKYLGDEIDIHAGGEDLIFPHHENEIAQSECCNDKIFAKYWMHNAFLNIDNRKMSKSLGNFRTVREISDSKRREEDLLFAADAAKRESEMKTRFLATMSHDIRTPLNGIIGLVNLSEQHAEDTKMLKEIRDKMMKSLKYLVSLVNDVLDMNKIQSGDFKSKEIIFDGADMMRKILRIYDQKAVEKGIRLEVDWEKCSVRYPILLGNPVYFGRILASIMDNAIKFSENDSSITVEVTTKNDKIFVSVKDHGIGISRKEINKIWERFYKSDLSRGKDKKGTGQNEKRDYF